MSLTYSRQSIASAVVPLPVAARNLQAMIRTVQLTPTTPTPSLPTAPIVPATWVPWLLSSMGFEVLLAVSMPKQSSTWPLPSSSTPLLLQSGALRNMFADRSGWFQSTPESITATTTALLPVVRFHASRTSMSASGTPPLWPELLSAHSSPKRGSLGVTWRSTIQLGSA